MVKQMTSFDVARRAGVSQPTVSRALRNLPGASAETQARVRQAAAELSYIPSDSGRSLSMRSTRRIAVVSEELTNPYYPELVEPLRRELARHELRTVVITQTEQGPIGLDVLADGSYDGVVLTTTLRTSSLPRDLTERGIPHVLANRVLDRPESNSCAVDNVGGARAIADLLVSQGHSRVATIQGPVVTSTGKERADALRAALRGHGVRLPRAWSLRCGFGHDAGYAAGFSLLSGAGRSSARSSGLARSSEVSRPSGADRPTAIVCGNDVIALGVLSAARAAGVSVPDDLTVIGFDDIPMAGWPLVALTTVRCDLAALARTAVELLLAGMANSSAQPVERRIPVSLVLRGTHAVAPI